jgi:hypothetical protein
VNELVIDTAIAPLQEMIHGVVDDVGQRDSIQNTPYLGVNRKTFERPHYIVAATHFLKVCSGWQVLYRFEELLLLTGES